MRTLILSDLHLSEEASESPTQGLYAGGHSLPKLLDRLSLSPLRVIINGDAFDFLPGREPLEFDVVRAENKARTIASNPLVADILGALGRVASRSGAVTIRMGNHDVELIMPEVQEVFRAAIVKDNPGVHSPCVTFMRGDRLAPVDVGGARILFTHGEDEDRFNRVGYAHLPGEHGQAPAKSGPFTYPPGSELVRHIMNPLRDDHGWRFIDFLKPDFHGAALAALAVDTEVFRQILKRPTLTILHELLQNYLTPAGYSFGSSGTPEVRGFIERLDAAELSPEEQEALGAELDGLLVYGVNDALRRAKLKLLREGLKLYARAHRFVAGRPGSAFFSLEPDKAELMTAQRLGTEYKADAVLMGHTHAARWQQAQGVLYVNTGTWIWLMRLPTPEATSEDWLKWLEELRGNTALDPSRQELCRQERRLTVFLAEPAPDGGASVCLAECSEDGTLSAWETAMLAGRRTKVES